MDVDPSKYNVNKRNRCFVHGLAVGDDRRCLQEAILKIGSFHTEFYRGLLILLNWLIALLKPHHETLVFGIFDQVRTNLAVQSQDG